MAKRIDEGVVGGLIATFIYGLLAIVVFLGWASTGHCAEKPKVELFASPMVSIASPGHPSVITLRLVLTNADEKYNCPGIRYIWPNDTESFQEADCQPGVVEKRQSWIRRVAVGPGDHLFVVRIEKAGKVLARKSILVEVR